MLPPTEILTIICKGNGRLRDQQVSEKWGKEKVKVNRLRGYNIYILRIQEREKQRGSICRYNAC